jgi:anthranilate phosphoribosyltransferase
MFARRHVKNDNMDSRQLARVWRGEADDEYGSAATISTAAITLQLMRKADSRDDAMALAQKMWDNRVKDKYVIAA